MSEVSNKLLQQALAARRKNRLADARRDLAEAVDVCRKAGVRVDLAKALTCLGQIERDLHHGEAALQHYGEAAALYRAEGYVLRLAHAVRHLGDIHRESKRPDLAESSYREALDLYRGHEETSPLELANALRGLAILKDDAGETEAARLLWEEARELYASVNVEAGVAESSRRLARL